MGSRENRIERITVPFYQVGAIKYFTFSSLENKGIYHAIFTRHGGVSPSPWKSLNFGGSVGDDPNRVMQNREKALATINCTQIGIFDVYQVHSTEVVMTDRPLAKNEPHVKADAMITNQSHLTLLMRFADCVPILLYDPVHHVAGIVHAGWKGTVNKVAAKTVLQMHQNCSTQPGDILAAIGPAIGPDHYSVNNDVIEQFQKNFSNVIDQLISYNNGKTYLDLWRANQLVLSAAGVDQVEIAEICTQCNMDDWYSHRGEHGKTGRFGVVLGLY